MTAPASRVDAAIRALHDALTALLGALREERQLLAEADTAAYAGLLQRKSDLLARVERAEALRADLAGSLGHPPDARATTGLIAAVAAPDATRRRWDETLGLIEQVAQQNLANGALLALRRRVADEALALLQGRPVTGGGNYDRSGRVARRAARSGGCGRLPTLVLLARVVVAPDTEFDRCLHTHLDPVLAAAEHHDLFFVARLRFTNSFISGI
ncbi:MAG: flagellar protein FlgN, partial [Pseudomonadota bacterium]